MRSNVLTVHGPFLLLFVCSGLIAQDDPSPTNKAADDKPIATLPESSQSEPELRPPPRPEEMESPLVKSVCAAFTEPEKAKRLVPDARLWIDRTNRRVIIDGFVAVREGPLEMFICPYGTKEHESAISVLARSQYVHAALLAVAATPGRPVSFRPKFTPPTGDRIAIWVLWKDKDGKRHRVRGQEWVRRSGTDNILKVDWVFSGSQWWTDPQSGRDYYTADDGDLVCVSNFASATLDVPIESSKSNEYLDFSANTKQIPPRGTPVRVIMIPMDPPLNANKNKSNDKPKNKPQENSSDPAK